jgi:hypothetical protein
MKATHMGSKEIKRIFLHTEPSVVATSACGQGYRQKDDAQLR